MRLPALVTVCRDSVASKRSVLWILCVVFERYVENMSSKEMALLVGLDVKERVVQLRNHEDEALRIARSVSEALSFSVQFCT